MPKHLPTRELLAVVAKSVITAIRSSLHYTLVLAAWLIFIPMSSCRFPLLTFSSLVVTEFCFSSPQIVSMRTFSAQMTKLSRGISGCLIMP